MTRVFGSATGWRLQSLLGGAGVLICACLAGPGAEAANPSASPPPAAATEPAPNPNPSPPATPKPTLSVSKFEARRMRHACLERANKEGKKGAEREAFLTRCFFGRAAHRHQCRKQGLAKGLDKTALHDFVRECVKELRAHQKPAE